MRGVAVAPLVETLLIRNRKTVPHSNLAGLALSAVRLLPPVSQTISALSLAAGTRRGVRGECGIEESEELAEERLQGWD